MYTRTQFMTAIHRHLFSRFFLREGDVCTLAINQDNSANLFGEKDLQWSYPGCLLFENTQINFLLNLVLVLILESKGLYCSCKQDTKERQWRQQFCQMERDILVHQTKITGPVKEDHLQSWSRIFRSDQTEMVHSIWCIMYQPKFLELWVEWKKSPWF